MTHQGLTSRQAAGSAFLSGGDFELLVRTSNRFVAWQTHSVSVALGEEFLVNGEVLSQNSRLRELLLPGQIPLTVSLTQAPTDIADGHSRRT
jgi:hypothetical protein